MPKGIIEPARPEPGERQPLTVLSVAFPLAPVSEDSAGGAEQVLLMLDRALVHAGHRSVVIACQGSRCQGALVATPELPAVVDEHARQRARACHAAAIAEVLGTMSVDIVHMHGLDFDTYLPEPGPAVLATLHLPPELYPPAAFTRERAGFYLSCVSRSQRKRCPPARNLVAVIENGVDTYELQPRPGRQPYVLALGRICPEKGFHRALAAARRAGVPMLLGGVVFPYPDHLRYFRERVLPLLDEERRFIGPVELARKRDLLAGARCVLVPSEVAETSSLVAMEALACGTPVITSGAGALADIVDHGQTGYVVTGEAEMAEAIRSVERIEPDACRRAAVERFSADRMTAQYLRLYRRLAGGAGAQRVLGY